MINLYAKAMEPLTPCATVTVFYAYRVAAWGRPHSQTGSDALRVDTSS